MEIKQWQLVVYFALSGYDHDASVQPKQDAVSLFAVRNNLALLPGQGPPETAVMMLMTLTRQELENIVLPPHSPLQRKYEAQRARFVDRTPWTSHRPIGPPAKRFQSPQ